MKRLVIYGHPDEFPDTRRRGFRRDHTFEKFKTTWTRRNKSAGPVTFENALIKFGFDLEQRNPLVDSMNFTSVFFRKSEDRLYQDLESELLQILPKLMRVEKHEIPDLDVNHGLVYILMISSADPQESLDCDHQRVRIIQLSSEGIVTFESIDTMQKFQFNVNDDADSPTMDWQLYLLHGEEDLVHSLIQVHPLGTRCKIRGIDDVEHHRALNFLVRPLQLYAGIKDFRADGDTNTGVDVTFIDSCGRQYSLAELAHQVVTTNFGLYPVAIDISSFIMKFEDQLPLEDMSRVCFASGEPDINCMHNLAMTDTFQALNASLNEFYSDRENVRSLESRIVPIPALGICNTQFPFPVAVRQPPYNNWHRALLQEIKIGEDSSKPGRTTTYGLVKFVDFGNLEWVPFRRIKTLAPQFMVDLPPFAYECEFFSASFDKLHFINLTKTVLEQKGKQYDPSYVTYVPFKIKIHGVNPDTGSYIITVSQEHQEASTDDLVVNTSPPKTLRYPSTATDDTVFE